MNLPAAVFWDMDGTIVDTEPFWMDAETRLVESYGGVWGTEQGLTLVGRGLEDSAAILQEAGVTLEIAQIVNRLSDEVTELLRTNPVPFRPGAVELLRALQDAGIPTALVTMSLRRMADAVIDALAPHTFDVVVTGDSSRLPKPHPDPYLQAAEAIGVEPSHCIVIEDSPGGIRSGVGAGAVTIGVPHMVELDGYGAHAIWPTLAGRGLDDLTNLMAASSSIGSNL